MAKEPHLTIRVRLGVLAAAAVALALLGGASPVGHAAAGDAAADQVFGQGGSFVSAVCNLGGVSASSLCGPTGAAVDAAGNLYVVDSGNHRILEYDTPLTTDLVADRVFGQPGFGTGTANTGGIGASTLFGPVDVAVDASGNVYVADASNHRVLEYDTPLTTDTVADRVFGQGGSFTSGTCNLGGRSAGSLCGPWGVEVDASGNLYVVDDHNERVLEYDSPLTTDTVADRVFGQGGSFTTASCNLGGRSASSLCNPTGIAVDGVGNLYLGDGLNNRVLEFNAPLATDTIADDVFGQPNLTSGVCNAGGVSASSLCSPHGVAVDVGGNVYVAERPLTNHRVLEYDSPLTTDKVADVVFGQPDFATVGCNTGGLSATSLCNPFGVAADLAGSIYVADSTNNRVLEYDSPLSAPDSDGDGVPDDDDLCTETPPGTPVDETGCPLSCAFVAPYERPDPPVEQAVTIVSADAQPAASSDPVTGATSDSASVTAGPFGFGRAVAISSIGEVFSVGEARTYTFTFVVDAYGHVEASSGEPIFDIPALAGLSGAGASVVLGAGIRDAVTGNVVDGTRFFFQPVISTPLGDDPEPVDFAVSGESYTLTVELTPGEYEWILSASAHATAYAFFNEGTAGEAAMEVELLSVSYC